MSWLKSNLKLILGFLWLAFATSMVTWWWIVAVEEIRRYSPGGEEAARRVRMVMWEGTFFFAAICIGGAALLVLLYRDRARHEQLKLFFSNFNHDLKTSMARIRLNADILKQEGQSESLNRLTEDINRLNLQLDNSLLLSTHLDARIFQEDVRLSDVVRDLRMECEELEIHMRNDVVIRGDRRIVTSLFRNLFHNSITHGQSTRVEIAADQRATGQVRIHFKDNGRGFSGDVEQLQNLGKTLKTSTSRRGFGLFVSQNLLKRMGSELNFRRPDLGFEAVVDVTGHLV